MLEHLDVYAASSLGGGSAFYPSIPTTFLGGSASALKSLHLNGINTSLNFAEFPVLIHLTLTTNPNPFHISELFRVFTTSKLLEEISVELRGLTMPIPEDQDVVQLPRMRRLTFSNTVGEFPGRLLPLLFMPSVEEVRLDITIPGEDMRTIRDFLPARLRNFPQLLKVDKLKLSVPHAHCNTQFSGPGGVLSINASRKGNQEQSNHFHSHWLDSLEPMSIADVKDLTLSNYHPEKSNLCPVLRSFNSIDGLQLLTVERCNNMAVIEALVPTTKGDVLFPHLESLMFQPISEQTTVFPGLVDMARTRSQKGHPLNKISSDRPTATTFHRSDVSALWHHVNSVQPNTGVNSCASEPANALSCAIIAVRINFDIALSVAYPLPKGPAPLPKKTGSQSPEYLRTGSLLIANERNNPLVNLAFMYSQQWQLG